MNKDIVDALKKNLVEKVRGSYAPPFIPTGIQDGAIIKLCQLRPRIFLLQTANKIGKTTLLIAGFLRNMFWQTDPDFFSDPH